ncbi:phosphonate ABC transporter substrate-binding protein [Klebsiella pneumoniae]|uniref:Phosphonate ABC transporter substrate-binding protein n=1 Tax=Klebsiella pneumoniae TaxID=573 RepID=A0A377WFZ4_KLEPN|nr:phosphonate ABC transporter substrate-binding protein [Klebsiella pneumoniae]
MKKYMTGAVRLSAMVAGMMMAWQAAAAQPKELNLGILGGQNATQQIGDNQCVKAFLDKELNVDTKLRNSSDYSGVIQGLLGGKVDVVLSMSPSSYASVYLNNPKRWISSASPWTTKISLAAITRGDRQSRLPLQNAGRFKRQSLRLRRSGFHFRVSDP